MRDQRRRRCVRTRTQTNKTRTCVFPLVSCFSSCYSTSSSCRKRRTRRHARRASLHLRRLRFRWTEALLLRARTSEALRDGLPRKGNQKTAPETRTCVFRHHSHRRRHNFRIVARFVDVLLVRTVDLTTVNMRRWSSCSACWAFGSPLTPAPTHISSKSRRKITIISRGTAVTILSTTKTRLRFPLLVLLIVILILLSRLRKLLLRPSCFPFPKRDANTVEMKLRRARLHRRCSRGTPAAV